MELKAELAEDFSVFNYLSQQHSDLEPNGSYWLEGVATLHVISAFAILIFIIAHVYLLTTGHSFKEHVMPMVTGYDDVELSDAEEAYLQQDEPSHIEPESSQNPRN